MEIPLIMPDLGMPNATLSLWFVEAGAAVQEGERLIEILAGAATFDISAPVGGRLSQRCVVSSDPVFPGQTLGYIERG